MDSSRSGASYRTTAGEGDREAAALLDPLLAPPVEQPHVLVPEELEVPVRIRGEPVVLVAVQDDARVVRDPAEAHEPLELLPCDDVADEVVLQVVTPVQPDGALDVTLVVEIGVLVHLRDDHLGVREALGQPVRGDEGMCVDAHERPCSRERAERTSARAGGS
jgi:hypothetical protein